MKRVNNSDINFLLNPKTVNLSNFNVRFYTVNSEHFFVRKSQDDVKTVEVETEDGETSVNYYLKLDWSELVTLGEGVLQYQLLNNYQDSDRADNYYNQNIERTTQYYIDSNVTVDEDEAESYAEIIAELGDKINSEITRSTSADTLQTEALNSEIQIRQDQINEILDIIDGISGETDLSNYYKKSETSGATEISNALGSKVNSQTFINHTADTNVHVTSVDKEKWDAKVDKSWIEEKLGSGFTGDNSANTVTSVIDENEEVVTAALTDLNTRKLDASAYTPTDLTNYYTKSETNDLLDNKLDASAYTPTDLTNYYTKSEVYNKTEIDNKGYITDISGKLNISDFNTYSADTKTLIDGKQNELVSGENIKTINNQSLLGSGNITIEGGSGVGGFITVTNPSADTKVGLVNSLSQYYDTNIGKCAVIEGDGYENNGTTYKIVASGDYSHAEGYRTSASTNYSHAEGQYTVAIGVYGSHAEGYSTQAIGDSSHAEGSYTQAIGNYSHSEGQNTNAIGAYSHAEGQSTQAIGNYGSHAEGYSTQAIGKYGSHAEGYNTVANNNSEHASGQYNVSSSASTTFGDSGNTLFSVGNGTSQTRHNAFEIRQNGDIYITSGATDIKLQDHLGSDEGSSGFIIVTNPSAETKVGLVNSLSQYYDTNIGKGAVIEGDGYEYYGTTYNIVASGDYSHAEGYSTKASGNYSHAEGQSTVAIGNYSHAEGSNTSAYTDYSHAEGYGATASGDRSHAEGSYTKAIGNTSHAEGDNSQAIGNTSHAEGNLTKASGLQSHAEGSYTTASGSSSHAEGDYTTASGSYSHAEGGYTTASGDRSHAEGYNSQAIGNTSHAEGSYTTASGSTSHAEGDSTQAIGQSSHAEGLATVAIGNYSHAEGQSTLAIGNYSHAEGSNTTASGNNSHAEGQNTVALNDFEHVSGKYNIPRQNSTTFGDSGNTLFSVGNGTNSDARHNAFEIRQNGDIYITSGGTNTSPMVKLQDNLGGNVDLSNYYTKTEVDDIVDDVVAGQIDLTTYAKIDWVQTNYALKTDVPKIWIGTQSEYDNITNKNENTVYIIK